MANINLPTKKTKSITQVLPMEFSMADIMDFCVDAQNQILKGVLVFGNQTETRYLQSAEHAETGVPINFVKPLSADSIIEFNWSNDRFRAILSSPAGAEVLVKFRELILNELKADGQLELDAVWNHGA